MLVGLKSKASSLIGTSVQVLGISHGAIGTAQAFMAGDQRVGRNLVYLYSGFDADSGSFDSGQAIKSAGIVAGSWLIGKAIKWVGRH